MLCIFLEGKLTAEYSLANLLGSLFKQLIQLRRSDPVSLELQMLYDARTIESNPKESDVRRLLHEEISKCEHVYLVVDALDECAIRHRLRQELYDLKKLKPKKVSLLVTS